MDYAVNAQSNRLLAGRYRMSHLLGSGGFGAVYFATDERLNRPVAIKVCSTRRLAAHEAQEAANLFQREALTLARLRHPGLTAIWDYFNQDDEWFLVMEYVPGDTLRDRLRGASGPLPHAEALDYASQICHVLSYLHSQQPPIVFRDLKPGNIMITPDGRVKLIDFGIARLFSPGKAADTVQFGTPGYAPPEQYGGQTEPRSDIYSLGVVLHQMLTGHNPASSPFRLPPARALNPAVSQVLEQLIFDATAYTIEHRVNNAQEFCSLLDAARTTPVMTQPLPRTGMIAAASTVGERQPRTLHTGQPWPRQPRALPERPAESSGIRSILVGFLLLLFLGAFAGGGYILSERINAMGQTANTSSFPPATTATTSGTPADVPSLLVFTADTPGGGRDLYRAPIELNNSKLQAGTATRLTDVGVGVEAASPAISPDGTQIAYTKVYPSATGARQTSEIWIWNVANRTERQVLANYAFASAPAWRPNGAAIAAEVATKDKIDQHDIVLLNLENDDSQPLVSTSDWQGGPSWSLDGTEIAYHELDNNVKCMQLFKINLQTGQRQQLTNLAKYDCSAEDSGDYSPAWGPDGKIAFARRNLTDPGSTDEPTNRVVVWDASLPNKPRITIYNNKDKNTGKIYPSDYPRWAGNAPYLLFREQRTSGYGLSYMDPTNPNKDNDYPIVELRLPYADIGYADWR